MTTTIATDDGFVFRFGAKGMQHEIRRHRRIVADWQSSAPVRNYHERILEHLRVMLWNKQHRLAETQ